MRIDPLFLIFGKKWKKCLTMSKYDIIINLKGGYKMNERYRNYIIIRLIDALKGTHKTYWHLHRLEDWQLLELYKILVKEDKNEESIFG